MGITGVILTKLDGDTRGGAALSVKAVTGKPIKFAGMGEKLEDLEPFYPERMASRILGMGDVLTFIEKAQANIDAQDAAKMAQRFKENKFDYKDLVGLLTGDDACGHIVHAQQQSDHLADTAAVEGGHLRSNGRAAQRVGRACHRNGRPFPLLRNNKA